MSYYRINVYNKLNITKFKKKWMFKIKDNIKEGKINKNLKLEVGSASNKTHRLIHNMYIKGKNEIKFTKY